MVQRPLTLGHSPDPDDAFMFYGLAKELIPTHGFRFEHILQDIQTLNERLDVLEDMLEAEAVRGNQLLRQPVEHEGIVGVGRVAEGEGALNHAPRLSEAVEPLKR